MFTFCLVTKGRRDYLPATLESLRVALGFDDVNIVIIDNGCPSDISDSLKQWCVRFDDRAKYVRFDVNETAATRVWDTLRTMDIDWISFPGDDDVIRPEFLESLRSNIKHNPTLVAAAASMQVIDSAGRHSGDIRRPVEFDGSVNSYLAGALSEPPFLFPALFFKFAVVKGEVPGSRYVFDWWLALNLIIAGTIKTTNEIAIDYRVHDGQESALAPKRRKYFEAQLVFSRFIDSSILDGFLSKNTSNEIWLFWSGLMKNKPIYQNQEFGKYILTRLGEKLVGCTSDKSIANQILGDLASMNGVLLRRGEIRSLSGRTMDTTTVSFANFKLTSADNGCLNLNALILDSSANYEHGARFVVGCDHSQNHYDFLTNCRVDGDESATWLDRLIVKITEEMELGGDLNFTLTPRERRLITITRNIKNRLPSALLNQVKRFLLPSEGIK